MDFQLFFPQALEFIMKEPAPFVPTEELEDLSSSSDDEFIEQHISTFNVIKPKVIGYIETVHAKSDEDVSKA